MAECSIQMLNSLFRLVKWLTQLSHSLTLSLSLSDDFWLLSLFHFFLFFLLFYIVKTFFIIFSNDFLWFDGNLKKSSQNVNKNIFISWISNRVVCNKNKTIWKKKKFLLLFLRKKVWRKIDKKFSHFFFLAAFGVDLIQ